MKKHTIRVRFFGSLALYTIVNFLLIGVVMFLYDVYEYVIKHAALKEEVEEVEVMVTVMAVLFPVSLLVAWGVSRQLLRPWKSMVVQAEGISEGRLEDRIEVGNSSDEIGRLAATLNRTFDCYQNLLDRMHRFSYDASHQLRNPLAAIRTNSEVCLKNPRSAEEYRAVIEDILESTVRLGRTVDQLLLLARASGSSLDEYRKPVALRKLAQGIVEEGGMIGELHGVSVELVAPQEELTIQGVPELIHEALSNLVDNALKFTPEGGHIEVGLRSVSSKRIRVEVADSGPGLTPAKRATIFSPFERADPSIKEGTGLGLAIVADVCRVHNGAFGVEDSPSGGCCFWMELPV